MHILDSRAFTQRMHIHYYIHRDEEIFGGKYGLGVARSLEEWMQHCGVDFAKGVISNRAMQGGLDS